MIDKLEKLGQSLRTPETHDALTTESFTLILSIDTEGNFLSLSETAKASALAEAIGTRTRGYKARTLLDKSDYTLGIDSEGKETAEQHRLFLEKLAQIISHVPALEPLRKFYNSNRVNGLEKAMETFGSLKNNTGNIAFLVNTKAYAHDFSGVKETLCRIYEEAQQKQSEDLAQDAALCSICGQRRPIPEIHDPIKKIPGGQSSGTALVSYNTEAFESYGLARNANASICIQCAKNYTNALNYLLSKGETKIDEKTGKSYFSYAHRKNMGGSCLLFWVKGKPETIPKELTLIEEPNDDLFQNLGSLGTAADEGQVKAALNSPAGSSSKRADHLDAEYFYALVVSGESARIAVRSWAESTLGNVRRSILRYFEDISIYKAFDGKAILSSLYFLTKAAEMKQDKIEEALWNCALFGKAPPLTLLSGVLKRVKITGEVSEAQAALIKLILNRNKKTGEISMTPKCDETNTNSAYLSGRLFAVMASVQQAALGDVNAGIADRFFTSASSTPAAAFGRLMKLNRSHLSKLSKEKPGLAVSRERLIQEICAGIENFPTLFSLEDQGRFALGYYHQKQELFTKKEENSHE